MALAASVWVTTEQELKVPFAVVVFAATAVLVVGEVTGALVEGEATGALALGAGPEDVQEDDPHAATRTVAKQRPQAGRQ